MFFKRLGTYLLANPVRAVLTPPTRRPFRAWAPLPLFAAAAVLIGLGSGVLRWEPLSVFDAPFLPIALLISPAFLEELVFRGCLIPRDVGRRGRRQALLAVLLSSAVYTLSHPLGALTTSTAAQNYFLNPSFLLIVALLGLCCSYSYVVSRSLWHAVLIHWLTVLAWVFLFGGYELVLALEGNSWFNS